MNPGGKNALGAIRPKVIAAMLAITLAVFFIYHSDLLADPYPPYWSSGSGPAVHNAPVAWPAEGAWNAYTFNNTSIKDQKIQDPSNGGTTPQNYVNVSSSCTAVTPDQVQPSVYWDYDPAGQMMFYRWRVEQIANNYATGPSAGSFSSTNPWNSAQWTVLMDTDGDGYREFVMHLDGSSGSPAESIDVMRGVYSNLPNNHVYWEEPGIHLIGHNPTAFVDDSTGIILNYQNADSPTTNWPSGSAATYWDYGSTRSTVASNAYCEEYFVDYQIPLSLLNATSVGGPAITADTPIALFFATANSLNNPFQKDLVYEGDIVGDPNSCVPFQDLITLNGGTIVQPVVDWVTATGCGPATLKTSVRDGLTAPCATTVTAVVFYYYYDKNSNGLADDGQSWTVAATASQGAGDPAYLWNATWDSTGLAKGKYLIGVKATDGDGNSTYSHLSSGLTAPNYYNPSPAPGVVYKDFINGCGNPPPTVTKSVAPSTTLVSTPVTFTLEVSNPDTSAISLETITDALPNGFIFNSSEWGLSTLPSATSSPSQGATGTVEWTWSGGTSIPAGSSRTLVFVANTPSVEGTYTNEAIANITGKGLIRSNRVPITVGTPSLTISKDADVATASPGATVTYTITYANDSVGSVTGTAITDPVPSGLAYVPGSASNGGTESGGTITWNIGNVAAGDGPFTRTYQATVDDPFSADPKVDNIATIDSNETSPVSATATVFVDAPGLGVQKDADVMAVFPGTVNNTVTFTVNYKNTSTTGVTNATISDPLPTGFVYNAASPSPTSAPAIGSNGTVTWNLGSLAGGASGSVTLTAIAANPYTGSRPATNTATLTSDQTPSVQDSFTLGVALSSCVPPVSGSDTSDSTFVLSSTFYDDDVRDYYVAPQNAYNQATYQEYVFNSVSVPSSYVINGVTLDYIYYEKNLAAAKLEHYVNGSYAFENTLDPSVSQNKEIAQTVDLYNAIYNAVDTVGEVNNLKTRFLAWSSQAQQNARTQEAEVVSLCVKAIDLVLDKQVDKLSASPGETLTYTIKFSNPGTASASGAFINDTVPTGSLFNSATLNGSPTTFITNTAVAGGRELKFNINSSDVGTAGLVNSGASGTLVITSIINTPIPTGVDSLTNVAVIDSTETASRTDSATTLIVVPNVNVSKSADVTLLKGGETVTYTVEALNSGSGTATGITVTDVVPYATYFTYVPGSVTGGDTRNYDDPTRTITWTIGSLASGASSTLTFQMNVSGVPPSGVTRRDNYATVSDAQVTGTRQSNTVTVSISANPNLSITKSAAPESNPLDPGDDIEYTVTLQNVGDSNAEGVQMSDPVPGRTSFKPGSILYNGSSQTDAEDSDYGYFDAVSNSVAYSMGTLSPLQTGTMKFSAVVDSALSGGTTTIDNLATGSASNAASKQASVSNNAFANAVLMLTKSGPSELPYPLTELTANATATNTVSVGDTSYVFVEDVISLNGTIANVVVVNSTTSQLDLDADVTGVIGDGLIPTYIYQFSYLNNGTSASSNSKVSDPLPTGIQYISASPAPSSDPGVGNNGTVTWTLGTLDPGESGSLLVRVRPSAAGSYDNNGVINATGFTNTPSNIVTTELGALDPGKTTSTPTVYNSRTGTQATYTITVDNQKATMANSVTVTDSLPAGFVYNSTTSATVSSGTRTSTVNPSPGDQSPQWGIWNMNGGARLTITFISDIANTVQGTYDNAAFSNSTNTSSLAFDELSTTAEDVTVLITNSDIGVTKAVDLAAPPRTGNVLYTITATNNDSTNTAEDVVLYDLLPSGVSHVSNTPSQGTWSPSTGMWTIGNISAGASKTLLINTTVTGDDDITITNCAQLWSSFTTDTDSSNNSACVDITPTLVLLKDFTAYADGGGVTVKWVTGSEASTAGFNLFRKDEETGEYVQVSKGGLLPGLLTSPQGGSYSYRDTTARGGGTYTYVLEEVEVNGGKQTFGPYTFTFGADGKPASDGEYRSRRINPEHPGSIVLVRNKPRVKLARGPEGIGVVAPSYEGRASLPPPVVSSGGKAPSTGVFMYFEADGTIVVTDRKPDSKGILSKRVARKSLDADGTLVVADRGTGGGAAAGHYEVYPDQDGTTTVAAGPSGDSYSPAAYAAVTPSVDVLSHAAAEEAPAAVTGGGILAASLGSGASVSTSSIVLDIASLNTVDLSDSYTSTPNDGSSSGGSDTGISDGDSSAVSAPEDASDNDRLESAKDESEKAKEEKEERSGAMVKIFVDRDGLYYVSAEEVSQRFGVSRDDAVGLIKKGDLALMSLGEEVAYAPASDDAGLYFYGMAADSIYTDENVYWLYNEEGLEMGPVKGKPPEPGAGYETFADTAHAEEDMYPVLGLSDDPDEDYWIWDYVISGISGYDRKSFTVRADGAASTGAAVLRAGLWSSTDTDAANDHHVAVYVNGDAVGEAWWDGATRNEVEFEFSQSLLVDGDNTVELRGLLDTGAAYSIFYLDSFELSYARRYEAVDGSLVFRGDGNATVTVSGFASPDVMVFDITDPYKPEVVEAVSIAEGADASYSVSLSPGSADSEYIALSTDAAITDFTAWADEPSALASGDNGADYVVITPDELAEAAQDLADYRQGQGLEAMVVKLEDVMDEFNYGNFSPHAIGDFLAYAHGTWSKAPRYVVLLGEGTYDYRDIKGLGGNLMPPAMVDTPYGLYPSDNYLADADGDGVPDVAIGRLPMLTSDEVAGYLSKVKTYEGYDKGQGSVLLAADDPDDGGDFTSYSDRLAGLVADGRTVEKVYLADHSTSDARALLMDALGRGAAVFNYVGHGSPDSMAYEGLFKTSDVASIEGGSRLAVVSAMTCFVGNYAYPGYDSLGEALLLEADAGAVAVWSPSGLSLNAQASALNEKFFEGLFLDEVEAVGDAVLAALQEFGGKYPDAGYIIDIYNVLGDPALRLR